MTIVELIRLEESEYGTFGALKINKGFYCVTLEPPDEENAVNKSSIPAQQYLCTHTLSPRFGETFKVDGVPGRSDILFHAGNVARHTAGCIILAQHVGKLRGKKAVLNSGKTFKRFMDLMSTEKSFHLTIREVY